MSDEDIDPIYCVTCNERITHGDIGIHAQLCDFADDGWVYEMEDVDWYYCHDCWQRESPEVNPVEPVKD